MEDKQLQITPEQKIRLNQIEAQLLMTEAEHIKWQVEKDKLIQEIQASQQEAQDISE